MVTSRQKEFIRLLESVTQKYTVMDVFSDFCAMAACSLEKAFTHEPVECEARYMATVGRYTHDEAQKFPALLAIVMEALEERRESFLGPVLEEIGAANVKNGQFLTPATIANLMGDIVARDSIKGHVDGNIIKIHDPACGAGVLLIAQAEKLVEGGVKPRDIYIEAGDIDGRACDIAFVELTLLGYAAKVEHADALAMKRYSRPRWTPCYFLYGTQWRENRGRGDEGHREADEPSLSGTDEGASDAGHTCGHDRVQAGGVGRDGVSGRAERGDRCTSERDCASGRLHQATFDI